MKDIEQDTFIDTSKDTARRVPVVRAAGARDELKTPVYCGFLS